MGDGWHDVCIPRPSLANMGVSAVRRLRLPARACPMPHAVRSLEQAMLSHEGPGEAHPLGCLECTDLERLSRLEAFPKRSAKPGGLATRCQASTVRR